MSNKPNEKILTVATVQHACCEDRDTNQQRSIDGITRAAAQGAQLVLLQELHSSLYFCQTENAACFDLAEAIPGHSSDVFAKLAKQLGIVIVTSLFERRTAGIYHNTAVVFNTDGSIAGKYRKMHIPDDPGYYEKFYFTPGDLGFEPINTSVGRLGVLVCWDQWYPEAARLMALAGAELLLYPTAIGWDLNDTEDEKQRQRDAWETVQRAHAIANGLPVIVSNRHGYEVDPSNRNQGIQFWGSSFIAGPQGELLAKSPANSDSPVQGNNEIAINVVELSLSRSEKVRRNWPFLRDRRIDAYHDILLRYRDK